jgi:peptidoglycan hydrolase-like protein with peptidoglycan-binding domain
MKHRRLVLPLALTGAAIVGAVVTVAVRGGSPAPATPRAPRVSTATVVRTDLASTVLTAGTLGYAPTDPVVNRLSGTYTQLPALGAVIAAGQVLYRVDNQPVVLMSGATPAWRPFTAGMPNGPDVSELQSNLIDLGYARGLLSDPTGHLDTPTVDAIEGWQRVLGYPATGQIALGQVLFEPSSLLVGAQSVAAGQAASPGDLPYQVTTTTRTVTVPLNPDLPQATVGEAVSIVLPTNATAPGRITAIGPAPPSAVSGSGTQSGSGSSVQSQASSILTVTPTDAAATGPGSGVAVQVSLTTQSVSGVLALPVSALLALSGGGYGVEVVTASGLHHLVAVTTGVFAGGRVQVSGAGIASGTKVVVAQ